MKRFLWLFAVLFLCAPKAHAQLQVPGYANDPATCDPTRGLIYFNTTSQTMKYCSGLNVWSAVGTATPPATPSGSLQFNNAGAFGGVAGSAVTAGTGAIALTASGDTVTPITLFGHSATQSKPVAIFSYDGSTNCTSNIFGAFSSVCISSNNGQPLGILGISPQIVMIDTNVTHGVSNFSFSNNSMQISAQGSDGMAAYITLGDDFAPQQSNVSIYSELWTYFGSNSNVTWNDAINSQTGQIRAGWIPDKAGQVAQTGFLSVVDAGKAFEVNIKNPGTMAANYNLNVPITAGSAGQVLTSQGGGTTPMTWSAFPVPVASTTCGTCPINNPTINVDQGMIQLSLGAGYLNLATRPFSIEAAGNYTTTAASAPALNFEVQLCTVSGCGSGTVVDLIDITTTTLSATALSNATWTISATCVINATGATGNLVCKGSPGLTLDTGASIVTPDSTFADTNTAVSGNIDLTAALFLRFTVAQSVAGASNSYTQTLASIR